MATRKRRTPEQVVRKLIQADRMLAEGKEIADVCREVQVSPSRITTAGVTNSADSRLTTPNALKDLERENATLKRLLAEAELEKAALKEIARGNF
jgi:hypothetical protein